MKECPLKNGADAGVMKKTGYFQVRGRITIKTLMLNGIIAIVYIISGKLGLSLASVNPSTTAIWPPTGIGLAALVLFGYRAFPAIFFGAFIVNLTTAGTIATSLAIAGGNTLEAVVGSYLLIKFAKGTHAFSRVADIFKFVLFTAVLSTMVSADIGALTLILGKLATWANFFPIWTTWWLGDMGGNLIFAPLIILWWTTFIMRIDFKKTIHILLSFFLLYLTTVIVFFGILPFPYLCIPIAVWIAFWFGRRGATAATLLVASIAILYTLHGFGPFVSGYSANNSLILLQLFLGILSITSLTFSALVHTIREGEKTMTSREVKFQALIEKSFDAVVLIDASSKILYASPSVKQVLGYTPEELIGKTGFDLVAPQHRSLTMRELAKLVLKPKGVVTVEYQTVRKDKRMIWVEAIGTNLLFEQNVNGVVVNFHDITDHKRFEEKIKRENAEDEALLASIGEGIVATDNTGKITMTNQAACDMLGWTKKDLLGKKITVAIPMQDEKGKAVPLSERPMTKVLLRGKTHVSSQTNYYLTKKNEQLPIRFTLTPIVLNGSTIGTIEVFSDISKEKEIDRMKDEFISMASHELRTPMTAVNGLLSMIQNGDYGPVNEKLKQPLDNVRFSAKRQIHLINDLLDVSRLQTGRIDFTISDFSLRQILSEIINSLMPIAQQKHVTLEMKDSKDSMVHADSEWSKHILNNLIGNALKFTDRGGVSVSYAVKNNLVSIFVSDTGSGIDPADHNKLFGKFQQLNRQTTGKPPGSGLGLYLSRELARKMGGEVTLKESTLGKGSTFALILPLKQDT